MEPHPDHRILVTLVDHRISPPTSLRGMTLSTWAPGTPTSRLLLTRTSHPPLVLLGTVMRGCGMSRGIQATGVEVHPGKEDHGVGLVALTQVPHHGTLMTSSHHGETSLTSPPGVRGSPRFHHACRGRPISEDPSLLTSSLPHSTSLPLHHIILDVSLRASCKMTFLQDITTTGHPTPHIDSITPREISLEESAETCQVLLLTTILIRDSPLRVWGLNTLPGVEASTQSLDHPLMASMAIHHTCAIDSTQSRMTRVLYPTSRILICQLV